MKDVKSKNGETIKIQLTSSGSICVSAADSVHIIQFIESREMFRFTVPIDQENSVAPPCDRKILSFLQECKATNEQLKASQARS